MHKPWWGTGTDTEGVMIAPAAEALAEFRFGALCVADLVSAWRVVSEGRRPRELDWKLGRPDTAGIGTLLDASLRPALTLFSPSALFIPQGRVSDARAAAEVVGTSRWTQVPLYNRCLLELFNHIAERAAYRTCKECGRLFVRQEGRARFRQHRTRGKGAPVFCSVAHASAYTTRASRRRMKTTHAE